MFFAKKKSKKNIQRGFTLVELMVAILVFSLVTSMVVEVFLTALAGSERIAVKQNIQDSGRFMMETAAKEIRMSTIQNMTCDTGSTHVLDSLSIINSNNEAVTYVFSGNNFLRNGQTLNSAAVKVTFGKFYVQKICDNQPRFTIAMKLEPLGGIAAEQVAVNLQNTISSRQYLLESEK